MLVLDKNKIDDCKKLSEVDHPYLIKLDQVMDAEDGALLTISEREHSSLEKTFSGPLG